MSDYAVSATGIHMSFQKKQVLKNLDFQVKKGDVCALLGPNGAGKTTLLKILTGLTLPDEGYVRLFGGKPAGQVLRRTGCLIEKPSFYSSKTTLENLKIHQALLGIPEDKSGEILELVGLSGHEKKKAGKLSLGMKQRLAIGMALMGSPDMLILDEPVNSLDTQGMYDIRQLLKRLNREQDITMIISSHLLDEISLLASSYAFLKDGQIQQLSKGQVERQSRQYGEIITDDCQKAVVVLDHLGFSEKGYEIMADDVIHIYEKLDALGQVNSALVQNGVQVSGLSLINKTLSDFYLDRMSKEGQHG